MKLTTRRILATLIDMTLVGLPVGLISTVFGIIHWIMSFIPVVKWFRWIFHLGSSWFVLPYCLYEIICLACFHTTIGKALMGVGVEEENGVMELRFSTIVIRSVFKMITFQFCAPLLLLVSFYIMLKEPEKSLHDVLAGTITWLK